MVRAGRSARKIATLATWRPRVQIPPGPFLASLEMSRAKSQRRNFAPPRPVRFLFSFSKFINYLIIAAIQGGIELSEIPHSVGAADCRCGCRRVWEPAGGVYMRKN